MTITYRKHGREYLGGDESPKFVVGDANADCLPSFQKYCSEFINIRHLKRKIHFFYRGRGITPSPDPSPVDSIRNGVHWGKGLGSGLGEEWGIPRPNQAFWIRLCVPRIPVRISLRLLCCRKYSEVWISISSLKFLFNFSFLYRCTLALRLKI